jgi:hypothetical protein
MSPAPKQGERYELSQEKCADGAARADARNARDPPPRHPPKIPRRENCQAQGIRNLNDDLDSAWAS